MTDLAGEQGTVRPIELQVVGAQLQAGTKEKLVERFLEKVIKDC